MDATQSTLGLVLAGGQSSRMGQDKALIVIDHMSLLQHVCECALQCADRVFVVTFWPERYQPLLPPRCQLIQEQFLPNTNTPQGPMVGLAQGLAHIVTSHAPTWVLVLACDLPCLQVDALQTWVTELPTASNAIALLPRHPKGWETLCGFYHTRCLPSLTTAIANGERSLQRWLAKEVVQELPVSDRTILFNCNTPDDLAQINAR